MAEPLFFLAGFFLAVEGAISIAANPKDPFLYQLGRVTRILIGAGLIAQARSRS